jgi:hypothetical protein
VNERQSSYDVAAGTAFARSTGAAVSRRTRPLRIRPSWLAFVVGIPGLIGAVALAAALPRGGVADGAFPLAIAMIALALGLLILGAASRLWMFPDGLAVRFFGLRKASVQFGDITSATFGMVFPSISFALRLTQRSGRTATIHANWWDDEAAVMVPLCRALLDRDVPVDQMAATIIGRVLGVDPPPPRIQRTG